MSNCWFFYEGAQGHGGEQPCFLHQKLAAHRQCSVMRLLSRKTSVAMVSADSLQGSSTSGSAKREWNRKLMATPDAEAAKRQRMGSARSEGRDASAHGSARRQCCDAPDAKASTRQRWKRRYRKRRHSAEGSNEGHAVVV